MPLNQAISATDINFFTGIWQGDEEDGRIQYKINWCNTEFCIYGVDTVDGEKLLIGDIRFDDKLLKFSSFMPSIGRFAENTFQLISQNEIQVSFVHTVYFVMKQTNQFTSMVAINRLTRK
jgi:hypothetical protein